MKTVKPSCSSWIIGSLALALAFLSSPTTSRANVYATDIQVNGNLTNALVAKGSPVSITYHLNQAATAGVTVKILNGNTVVATMSGGTAMGLNTVSWTPPNAGTYSVSITAAATGFPFWTQISTDANPGNVAGYSHGMTVDCNTNSPYYGRVYVNNGLNTTTYGVSQLIGIYKYNADATLADEGAFGDGNYLTNNSGQVGVGEMAQHGSSGHGQEKMRMGSDDRVYMCDYSNDGSIVAFDALVSTNQMVIDQGSSSGNYPSAPNYSGNLDFSDINNGIDSFDVTTTPAADTAVWLCDNDYPCWGIWMYHMTNGAADPADNEGTQAVTTGGDLSLISSAGCMIDTNLDIFVAQDRVNTGDTNPRAMVFTNWNGGVLAPEAGGFNYSIGTAVGQALWAVGAGDDTFSGIVDTLIDSRTSPKFVALPMVQGAPVAGGYSGDNGGIRVLNAADGSVVSVTNGATVQTLTNIDFANWYTCGAWDNVGNLYAASTTTNYWRVWSPPGANTNTTAAVVKVVVQAPFAITGITVSPTTPGCASVTITFNAPGSLAPSAFKVIGSPSIHGTYTPVTGATITGGSGTYQATFSNCSTEFYQIEQVGS